MDALNINSAEALLKVQATLQKYNISLPTLIFVALTERDKANLTEIKDKILLSTSALTSIRDIAEQNRFVSETESLDRRKKFYIITDLGKELLASCRQ